MTMHPLVFTHASVSGHPDSCYFPASVSSATMNTGVQVSLWRFNLESFREIPRNAMTGLYRTEFCGSFFFSFEDALYWFPLWQVYIPRNREGFFFPHSFSSVGCHLSFGWQPFWLGWDSLRTALICSTLVTKSAEYVFSCLLAICVSSHESCLFGSLACVLIGSFSFLVSISWVLYIS